MKLNNSFQSRAAYTCKKNSYSRCEFIGRFRPNPENANFDSRAVHCCDKSYIPGVKPSDPTTKMQACNECYSQLWKNTHHVCETVRPNQEVAGLHSRAVHSYEKNHTKLWDRQTQVWKCKQPNIHTKGVYNCEKTHTSCVKLSDPTMKMQTSNPKSRTKMQIFDPEPLTVVKILTSLVGNRQN